MFDKTLKLSWELVGFILLISLQSFPIDVMGQVAGARSKDESEIKVQVCLPNKRIYFSDLDLDRVENYRPFTNYSQEELALVPKTILRVATSNDSRVANDPRVTHDYGIGYGAVLIRSGQYSDGAGFLPLKGSTVADQPVYETGYRYPLQNYVAIHVHLREQDKGQDSGMTYWFKLPKSVSFERFTEWFAPISMESDWVARSQTFSTGWKLTHGQDMQIYPVSGDTPKLRAILERRRNNHNDPKNDSLPALTAARLKYKPSTSDQQFVYEFVAKTDDIIPECE